MTVECGQKVKYYYISSRARGFAMAPPSTAHSSLFYFHVDIIEPQLVISINVAF